MWQKWQAEDHLSDAKKLMNEGDYEEALQESKEVLRIYPHSMGDRALYIIGLLYIHPENPDRDYEASMENFERLIEEFPESPLRNDTEIWIVVIREIGTLQRDLVQANEMIEQKNKKISMLESHIQELKDQIEELKNVDLGIEERKRQESP
jgi:outer membrane protein assembly factor BamD (BamD/ComL family)